MSPGEITFVLLTKNEENRLASSLASIPAGSSILVVDAESNDATVTVARIAGARVIVRAWSGFVDARRFAVSQVQTPWTFMLDADELLDERLRAALLEVVPSTSIAGFHIARTTYFCGRPIVGAGWGEEKLLRCFRTDQVRLESRPAAGGAAHLHERWCVEGASVVSLLDGKLLHYSYPTLASYWEKFDRYTEIEGKALRASLFGVIRACALALARFPWLFIVRAGYRDGWRGALICMGSALYPVVAALKAVCRR